MVRIRDWIFFIRKKKTLVCLTYNNVIYIIICQKIYENNYIKLSYNPKYKEKGTSYGPYLSIIIFCSLFQVILRTKKLEISIDLDEIKRKLARIYVVFNLKITKSFRK